VSRVITVDLHAAQIQGFFNIPVDNIFAIKDLSEYIKSEMAFISDKHFVLISPDVGGEKRIQAWHKRLETP
jgi:ribose-phosphate pyrophosphokinase